MSLISIRILQSDGRVERKRGYRHTDSWHEWEQDNFYGGSATKRMVIKEPSLRSVTSELVSRASVVCHYPKQKAQGYL